MINTKLCLRYHQTRENKDNMKYDGFIIIDCNNNRNKIKITAHKKRTYEIAETSLSETSLLNERVSLDNDYFTMHTLGRSTEDRIKKSLSEVGKYSIRTVVNSDRYTEVRIIAHDEEIFSHMYFYSDNHKEIMNIESYINLCKMSHTKEDMLRNKFIKTGDTIGEYNIIVNSKYNELILLWQKK